MLCAPLFSPWRRIWDSVCPELTRRVDQVVDDRQRGRNLPPQPPTPKEVSVLLVALELADGKLTSASFLQQKLVPLLTACAWPRWLLLEAALDEGSRAGDLHLVSQILRNQIEELDVLRAVANIVRCDNDVLLKQPQLDLDIHTVRQKVLPRLRTKSDEELLAHAACAPINRPASLSHAYDTLSEYVHPNYGSHMLAVRPHSPQAAMVICEAFLAVYEAFTGLPWVQEKAAGELSAKEQEPVRQSDPFRELADNTIPTLRQHLPVVSDATWETAADTFRRLSLLADDSSLRTDGSQIAAIGALNQSRTPPAEWPDAFRSASSIDSYLMLVTLEQDLVHTANHFLPEPSGGNDADRISVLLSALAFAITLTEYKLQSLVRRAATLINGSNVLGATIAVRSMIEHHAVAVSLSQTMDAIWERLEKRGGADVYLQEAEKHVARVLAGSAQPPDNAAAWRTLWKDTVAKPYNVMTPIKLLDEQEPGLLKTYGQLSHTVHGTIGTGGDLLGPNGNIARQYPTLAQLALFLAQLSTRAAMLDRQASAMLLAHRLHLVQENTTDLDRGIRDMALPAERKLTSGRDVHGDGTRESPFRFRKGLLYHEAFRRYLAQEGITMLSRQPVTAESGVVDCVTADNGQTLYFLNNTFPLSSMRGH